MPMMNPELQDQCGAAPGTADAVVGAIVRTFEEMQADGLDRLAVIYAPQVRFRDPFNDVTGLPAVCAIFADMYRHLAVPRFVVQRAVRQGDDVFLTWDMHFRFRSWQRGRDQVIHGASHLLLDGPSGLIVDHRDYWDVAAELYEKLPGLGGLMRVLKRLGRT